MDGSEDPALIHQLDSSQEEATHALVEEDHSFMTFVVAEKFSSYSDLKKKLSEFEESKSVQLTTQGKGLVLQGVLCHSISTGFSILNCQNYIFHSFLACYCTSFICFVIALCVASKLQGHVCQRKAHCILHKVQVLVYIANCKLI